jgi:hypothetical protein
LLLGTIGTGAASLSTLLLFVEVPHEKIPEVVLEDVVLEKKLAFAPEETEMSLRVIAAQGRVVQTLWINSSTIVCSS